ncbi:hypothetical protein DFJ73DRAFT_817487 [Zopfochytrium polystomum]|nr:hypothetical protein DFJ73DRAFT_817487 [Zopfochytrium polystomum]
MFPLINNRDRTVAAQLAPTPTRTRRTPAFGDGDGLFGIGFGGFFGNPFGGAGAALFRADDGDDALRRSLNASIWPDLAAGNDSGFGAPNESLFGGRSSNGFGGDDDPAAFWFGIGAGFGAGENEDLDKMRWPTPVCDGTWRIAFTPTDVTETSLAPATLHLHLQSITAMTIYQNWSFEELRLEDRKRARTSPFSKPKPRANNYRASTPACVGTWPSSFAPTEFAETALSVPTVLFQSITAMLPYKIWSFEELRLADHDQGRTAPSNPTEIRAVVHRNDPQIPLAVQAANVGRRPDLNLESQRNPVPNSFSRLEPNGRVTTAICNFGTGNPPFTPSKEVEQTGELYYQSITFMPNYKSWSFEELRHQDYALKKKGSSL